MTFKTLLATLLTLVFSTAGYAQALDTAKLDQFFDRLAEKDKAMGSLILAKDGQVLYSRTLGYSKISETEKKPVTAATRFRIGSISKLFTAVMVWQLIDEGKLKLTDTLDRFFPQVPNSKKITIEHMLGHRSGIMDIVDHPDFNSLKTKPKTMDEMVATVTKNGPLFEPGEKASYSNSNYLLLGSIIEKLTGKTYQENLDQRIASKIGLKNTYFGTGYTDLSKSESLSYRYAGGWKQEDDTHLSIHGGAGSMISTPADLVVFADALFGGKLVSKESLDQMMQKKLGMQTFPRDGKTAYGHSGGIDGFRAIVFYVPEEKLAFAATLNGANYRPTDIGDAVFDIYRNKPFTIPTFEEVVVKGEVLDRYVGVYSSPDFDGKFTITREGDTLYAKPGERATVSLVAAAENIFKYDAVGVVLEFDAAKKQMTMKRRGREVVFTKES